MKPSHDVPSKVMTAASPPRNSDGTIAVPHKIADLVGGVLSRRTARGEDVRNRNVKIIMHRYYVALFKHWTTQYRPRRRESLLRG